MLKAVTGEWGVQPQDVMSFGRFMARAGLLKAPPATWQDVFFPPVSGKSGTRAIYGPTACRWSPRQPCRISVFRTKLLEWARNLSHRVSFP